MHSRYFAVLLIVCSASGCLGLGPDKLQVFNESGAPIAVSVSITKDSSNETWSFVQLEGAGPETLELKRLSGPHLVSVSGEGISFERSVNLGRSAEYIQVFVKRDGGSIVTLHGD